MGDAGRGDERTEVLKAARRLAAVPDPVELWTALFAFAPVAFQIYRADGHCIITNRAFRALFGVQPPPEYNVLDDEIARENGVLELIRRAFAGETVTVPPVWYDPRKLTQVTLTEGRRVAMTSLFLPIFDSAHKVSHVAVVFTDLTEEWSAHERAEQERDQLGHALARNERLTQELVAREDRLKFVLAAGGLAQWELDLSTLELEVGESWWTFFGLKPDPSVAIYKQWRDRVHPDDLTKVNATLNRVLATGQEFAVEYRILLNPGLRWISSRGRVLRDPSGRPRRLVGVASDVTDRREASARVEEAAARFSSLVQASSLIIWTTDSEGNVVEESPSWRAFTGQTREQSLAFGWMDAVYPEDRPLLAAKWQEALAAARLYESEHRLRRADGEYRWMLARAAPVLSADGRILEWIGHNQDITERKEVEQERQRLHEETRQRALHDQRVVGIVSHDLRSPLSAISMLASALLRKGGNSESQVHALSRIVVATKRAERMIRDFLDYTQARIGGRIPINRTHADLHELTRQAVEELGVTHPGRKVQIFHHGAMGGFWDPDRISQVVGNLVGNALQHSPAGSPIFITTLGLEGDVELKVCNGGPPIPPDKLERLFLPFNESHHRRSARSGSIGLGLYITQQIVLSHGGTVEVRSTAAEGTTFVIRLPRHASAGAEDEASAR